MKENTGMVTEESLENFKQLYKKKYGIELTNEKATEQATAFLQLMNLILKGPTKKVKIEEQEKNNPNENIKNTQKQLTLL